MTDVETPSISVKEQYILEAKPDVALVKLYVLGEGMLMGDAVENVRKKVAEISEAFKSAHRQIERIDTFDVYLGQKEERLRSESPAYPRPLVVQGVLITARPDDPAELHRIMDEAIKRGALLDGPQRRSYLTNILDSALLFGVLDSERYEGEAAQQCLKRAEARARGLANHAGKRVGKLIEISGVAVEPSMGDPFHKDFVHIRRTFPTRFLSPTPDKVVICAVLTAKFELLDREKRFDG
jgi:uncharacterized protein YggE